MIVVSMGTTACAGVFEGILQHAGMLRVGPLHIEPHAGKYYWAGRHPGPLRVHLVASFGARHACVAGAGACLRRLTSMAARIRSFQARLGLRRASIAIVNNL